MSDPSERSVFERPLEALVFAPLGFALDARQLYPKMVDRGRNQILLARLVGRYATKTAMAAAEGALGQASGQATEVLRIAGILSPAAPAADEPDDDGPAPGEPLGGPSAPAEAVPDDRPAGPGARSDEVAEAAGAGAESGTHHPDAAPTGDSASPAPEPTAPAETPDVASLAIPDYDSLAASQVVPRLESLDAGELEAVRTYEASGRGRKTILAKIAQLQAV